MYLPVSVTSNSLVHFFSYISSEDAAEDEVWNYANLLMIRLGQADVQWHFLPGPIRLSTLALYWSQMCYQINTEACHKAELTSTPRVFPCPLANHLIHVFKDLVTGSIDGIEGMLRLRFTLVFALMTEDCDLPCFVLKWVSAQIYAKKNVQG